MKFYCILKMSCPLRHGRDCISHVKFTTPRPPSFGEFQKFATRHLSELYNIYLIVRGAVVIRV